MSSTQLKLAIAVTGASGSLYAKRLLTHLSAIAAEDQVKLEVGVVLSKNAPDVWAYELGGKPDIPFPTYAIDDFFAPFASGSAGYDALVIIPCSMGTLGRIAAGFSDDLTTRAADVMLKERRKLICVLRDTPLNLIHIQNMLRVTEAGGIMLPAAPSFYSRPQDFNQLADTVVHRVLDMLGLPVNAYRWGATEDPA